MTTKAIAEAAKNAASGAARVAAHGGTPGAGEIGLASGRGADAGVRSDWTRAEVEAIYRMALPGLVFRAQTVHRAHHAADRVQTCQLISIKTGGCPEDCACCPQSAHSDVGVAQ